MESEQKIAPTKELVENGPFEDYSVDGGQHQTQSNYSNYPAFRPLAPQQSPGSGGPPRPLAAPQNGAGVPPNVIRQQGPRLQRIDSRSSIQAQPRPPLLPVGQQQPPNNLQQNTNFQNLQPRIPQSAPQVRPQPPKLIQQPPQRPTGPPGAPIPQNLGPRPTGNVNPPRPVINQTPQVRKPPPPPIFGQSLPPTYEGVPSTIPPRPTVFPQRSPSQTSVRPPGAFPQQPREPGVLSRQASQSSLEGANYPILRNSSMDNLAEKKIVEGSGVPENVTATSYESSEDLKMKNRSFSVSNPTVTEQMTEEERRRSMSAVMGSNVMGTDGKMSSSQAYMQEKMANIENNAPNLSETPKMPSTQNGKDIPERPDSRASSVKESPVNSRPQSSLRNYPIDGKKDRDDDEDVIIRTPPNVSKSGSPLPPKPKTDNIGSYTPSQTQGRTSPLQRARPDQYTGQMSPQPTTGSPTFKPASESPTGYQRQESVSQLQKVRTELNQGTISPPRNENIDRDVKSPSPISKSPSPQMYDKDRMGAQMGPKQAPTGYGSRPSGQENIEPSRTTPPRPVNQSPIERQQYEIKQELEQRNARVPSGMKQSSTFDKTPDSVTSPMKEVTSPGVPRTPIGGVGSRPQSRSMRSDDEGVVEARSNRSSARPNRISVSRHKEGDNDSGVDESTQGNDCSNGDASPKKSSKIPSARGSSATTPTKGTAPKTRSAKSPKTPDSAAPTPVPPIKKVPMNKIQVGAAPSPNLKVIRSKIGSLDNASYKPGGGKVKIENKKLDFAKVQPKIAAKNEKYEPKGGDKKIQQVKLKWEAKPKIGSLDNATYRPGGGDKKIETVKLDFKEKAKPKIGSKDNIKHVPSGGDVKIETKKIEFNVSSKIGSLDNMKHRPGGGEKKIFDDKDYLRQMSASGERAGSAISGSQNSHYLRTASAPPGGRKSSRPIGVIHESFEEEEESVSMLPSSVQNVSSSRSFQSLPLITTPGSYLPEHKNKMLFSPDERLMQENEKNAAMSLGYSPDSPSDNGNSERNARSAAGRLQQKPTTPTSAKAKRPEDPNKKPFRAY